MSTPATALKNTDRVKLTLPARTTLMPESRAPSRFTAAARSALPYIVRLKKSASNTMSAALTPSSHSA